MGKIGIMSYYIWNKSDKTLWSAFSILVKRWFFYIFPAAYLIIHGTRHASVVCSEKYIGVACKLKDKWVSSSLHDWYLKMCRAVGMLAITPNYMFCFVESNSDHRLYFILLKNSYFIYKAIYLMYNNPLEVP